MSLNNDVGTLEDWVSCVYDPNHQMKARKLPMHLQNCRNSNPEKARNISICEFNTNHHVYTHDMDNHLKICRNYQNEKGVNFRESLNKIAKEMERRKRLAEAEDDGCGFNYWTANKPDDPENPCLEQMENFNYKS